LLTKPNRFSIALVPLVLCTAVAVLAFFPPQTENVARPSSSIRIIVGKMGLFSGLGHEHIIEAPIAEGHVDTVVHTVHLRFEASQLRVADIGISDSDRREIQATMLGPKVLDASHFPSISFDSTAVQKLDPDHWRLTGNLTLHGVTQLVAVDVRYSGGVYHATSGFRQSIFGIKPVSSAGGSVRVKDELEIHFDGVLPL
jgi:polyisoprenoid-binding protein YceI